MLRKLMLLLVVLTLATAVPVFGAASTTAGEVLGFAAPGAGSTVRLPIMLLDAAGAVVTGEAFNAAGMDVDYSKDGDTGWTNFPTFDTNNWDEIGNGFYVVILRQSDGTELGLLDTVGHFYLYVNTTAARGDVFTYKVNSTDVARTGADSDTLETLSDQVDVVALEATVAAGFEDVLHSNWDIMYVDAGGDDSDGSTWVKAHQTITAALTAAGDETTIFVAAGTYAEAITIANNNIELKSFDYDTPFSHSAGTVRVTGAANVPTCSVTGNYVEIIGIDFTDHATGERDGIYANGADDLKITDCTVEGINGELRDGIRVLGNSREFNVYGCHIYGAEGNGINITAAEVHTHIWDTSIQVATGATSAINLSGTITNAGINDCRLYAEGTVAAGIVLSVNATNNRVTNTFCHNFTTPYSNLGGVTNSFINVYDAVAYAVAGDAMDLVANAVDATSVATGAIDADAIAASAIGASELATGCLTADEFAADAIVAATLNTGVLTADAFAADSIVAATLNTGVLTADAFAADAIVAATLATNSISADAIADSSIDAGAIATSAIGAAEIAADAIGSSELATTAVTEIANAVSAAGAGITTYYAQVQRNELTAARRTVYFYATGTLPANASISTNGGAFGNSDNAPATINGNRRKLEIARAELATRGRLLIDVTTTVAAQTAIIIVDVVDFDPFTEGSVTDVGRRVRGAQGAIE